jgi:hypothetical protein
VHPYHYIYCLYVSVIIYIFSYEQRFLSQSCFICNPTKHTMLIKKLFEISFFSLIHVLVDMLQDPDMLRSPHLVPYSKVDEAIKKANR